MNYTEPNPEGWPITVLIGFYLARIMAVLAVTGIFLPPDVNNPHVLGDSFLAIGAGLLWASSDIFLKGLKP
jgi:hypothetical protein